MTFIVSCVCLQKSCHELTSSSRWWFQIFFMFTPIWGRFPIWLYFSDGLKPPTSHVQRIHSSSGPLFMDQPMDPWVHLQRFCSPNDDVNKGQLLSESLGVLQLECLPSFTPGVCPTWILVGCGHATKKNEKLKFLVFFSDLSNPETVSIAS